MKVIMLCMGMERVGGRIPIQETISNEEIKAAVSRLIGKSPRVDGITADILKGVGREVVTEWLHKIYVFGRVPYD